MTDIDVTETAQQTDALAPGTVFAEKFEILARLGEGGMSVVYKVRQLSMDRIVALKVLHVRLLANATAYERFRREAQIISGLEHENIVRVLVLQTDADEPYMAMEFIDGGSLAQYVKDHGRLSASDAVSIVSQAARGLAHAHERGVVHRDVKPANIMLSDGRVQVVDFGVARLLEDDIACEQKLTRTNSLLGTPYYMSPEQCEKKWLDARSDIYALGCVLYELLAGRPPFTGDSPYAVMFGHVHETPQQLPSNVPAWLQNVCMKMLEKEPDKRFASMNEVVSALGEASKGTVRLAPRMVATRAGNSKRLTMITLCAITVAAAPFLALRWFSLVSHGDQLDLSSYDTIRTAWAGGEKYRQQWEQTRDSADRYKAQTLYRHSAKLARAANEIHEQALGLWAAARMLGNPDGLDDAKEAIQVFERIAARCYDNPVELADCIKHFEEYRKTFGSQPSETFDYFARYQICMRRIVDIYAGQHEDEKALLSAQNWLEGAISMSRSEEEIALIQTELAQRYMNVGRTTDAEKVWKEALEVLKRTKSPDLQYRAIDVCSRLREFALRKPINLDESLRLSQIAVDLQDKLRAAGREPDEQSYLNNLHGVFSGLLAKHRHAEAAAAIERALPRLMLLKANDPFWVVIYGDEGRLFRDQKKYNEAEVWFAKASDRIRRFKIYDPNSVWALSDQAYNAAMNNQFDTAISAMQQKKFVLRKLLAQKSEHFKTQDLQECDGAIKMWTAVAGAKHGA